MIDKKIMNMFVILMDIIEYKTDPSKEWESEWGWSIEDVLTEARSLVRDNNK